MVRATPTVTPVVKSTEKRCELRTAFRARRAISPRRKFVDALRHVVLPRKIHAYHVSKVGILVAKTNRPTGANTMSNVTSYQKNSSSPPNAPSPDFVRDSDGAHFDHYVDPRPFAAPLVDISGLDLSPPPFSIRGIVIQSPVPAVLIAAGIGLIIGGLVAQGN